MLVFGVLVLWYITGLLGSVLVIYYVWYRGGFLTIRNDTIVVGLVLAMTGLINLFIGIAVMIYFYRDKFNIPQIEIKPRDRK